jgi:hypothetical protein
MNLKNTFLKCLLLIALPGLGAFQNGIVAQTPQISLRLANPQNNCATQEYCLDVEFSSDIEGYEIFGMNVRFFYDDDVLELIDFRDFQGGYGAVAPNPPIITTSIPGGPALFNFPGPAEFVNGAIQLVNTGAPPIPLNTNWTKIFQLCFEIDGLNGNLDTFCPAVVWDLEQDPSNGGFLSGDDGVVITVVDPDPDNESLSTDEQVVQFNWEYIGNGEAPYGQPVEITCSNVNCALPVTLLSFSGTAEESGNLLKWHTVNEFNLSGFTIERSQDKLSWTPIGFVESEIASIEMRAYQFLDHNPSQGRQYYRLQQMDKDGYFEYSKLISVTTSSSYAPGQIYVYPNPVAEGTLFITLAQEPLPGGIVRLVNVNGQTIKEEHFRHSGMELDIKGIVAGVYLIHVTNGQEHYVAKVIVE